MRIVKFSVHLQVMRLVGVTRRVLRASVVQVLLWGSGGLLILVVGGVGYCVVRDEN